MTDTKLKMCPCGHIPKNLHINEGTSCKYAYVTGDCCDDWHIEFRTKYKELYDPVCMELAISAWNESTRWTDK